MSRALLILGSDLDRRKAMDWIKKAPVNTRITFQGPKRSIPQSDKMWALLTIIADKTTLQLVKLSAEDWKLVFLDALKRETRIVPNLDNTGFVNLGRSSSNLSKEEMSDLLELITAYMAEKGIA